MSLVSPEWRAGYPWAYPGSRKVDQEEQRDRQKAPVRREETQIALSSEPGEETFAKLEE